MSKALKGEISTSFKEEEEAPLALPVRGHSEQRLSVGRKVLRRHGVSLHPHLESSRLQRKLKTIFVIHKPSSL